MPKLKTDGYLQSALGRAARTDPSPSSSIEIAPEIIRPAGMSSAC
jgi:hypothetical protein